MSYDPAVIAAARRLTGRHMLLAKVSSPLLLPTCDREAAEHSIVALALVADLLEAGIDPVATVEGMRARLPQLAKSGAWLTELDDHIEPRPDLQSLEDEK